VQISNILKRHSETSQFVSTALWEFQGSKQKLQSFFLAYLIENVGDFAYLTLQ